MYCTVEIQIILLKALFCMQPLGFEIRHGFIALIRPKGFASVNLRQYVLVIFRAVFRTFFQIREKDFSPFFIISFDKPRPFPPCIIENVRIFLVAPEGY